MPESAYQDNYKPIVTTTTTLPEGESNITIDFINVQNNQIFNSDIELRVRIVSSLPMEDKTLFVNNNYFGDLINYNDNIYGMRIPKDMLKESNEIKVHVMDRDNNILEKAIRVVIGGN
jgi:hypothetical protein